MVLKARTAAPQVESAPAFETEDDVAVVEAPAQADTKSEVVAAPAASNAQVAVRPATAGAVAVKPAPVNMADFDVIGLLENRLPPVDYGEGVRLVGSNGQLMDTDKKLLGEFVTMTALSWNKRWVISPGDNGAEAKEHARYSMDGEVTTKGEDVREYLQELKNLGYSKASVKEYVDLFGILEEAGKPTDHLDGSVVVSMSPDSVKALAGFRRDLVVKGMMGRIPPIDISSGLRIKVRTEVKSGNGNTWTRLVCELA